MDPFKLSAGTLNDDGELTVDSMSWQIDEALRGLVKMGANEDPRGRRTLALAIARGVIKHLQDRQLAFTLIGPGGVIPDVKVKIEADA